MKILSDLRVLLPGLASTTALPGPLNARLNQFAKAIFP
jgi:hypothetical protein